MPSECVVHLSKTVTSNCEMIPLFETWTCPATYLSRVRISLFKSHGESFDRRRPPSVQRITRYPLLIKQVLHYTESSEDRQYIERALEMAEKVLNHINETIREQEDRERLKVISRDLWIGQG